MEKNRNSDIFASVITGLSTIWANYKRSARRRNETPSQTFWNDLLGAELNDAQAAKFLAEDVAEIREKLSKKKTDKKFNDIIENSF